MRGILTTFALLVLSSYVLGAPPKEDEAQAILDKAIEARGGAKKLADLKTIIKAKLADCLPNGKEGAPCDIVVYFQAPDKLRYESTPSFSGVPKTTYLNIFDGNHGWTVFAGRSQEMGKKNVLAEAEKYGEWGLQLVKFKGKDFKLALLNESKINKTEAVGVKVSGAHSPTYKLYFDKKTGLLLKRDSIVPGAEVFPPSKKDVRIEILFEDYKEVDGIQYPTRVTTLRNGEKTLVQRTSEFKIVKTLDEGLFAKPK